MTSTKKTLTLLSRHYFSSHGRKTTVHFMARQFAKRGYRVNFVTVGRSILSLANKSARKGMPPDLSRKKFQEVEPGIFSIVMDEIIHPVSTGNKILNLITSPKILGYGEHIPDIVSGQAAQSSIVLIECGYGVAYYRSLKDIARNAKFIYFATDPLSQVGLRPEFENIERESLPEFDLVRVANRGLSERFPANTNAIEIPQGIDKAAFDAALQSPYPLGSKNLISIGDMAFDTQAIRLMAGTRPDVTIHVFGADICSPYPDNIIVHGEVEFSKLVPYIKFADVGIMPYKMNSDMSYLTKTSLKFLQYTYCGLPILTPAGADWKRENIFYYIPNDAQSISSAMNSAISQEKDLSMGTSVWDWNDCVEELMLASNNCI